MESTCNQTDFAQITEIELVYKSPIPAVQRPVITRPEHAFSIFHAVWNHNLIEIQEELKVLLLNKSNRLLGVYHAASGCIDQVSIDTRLILACAVKAGAIALVLAHNHPSGTLEPSKGDLAATQKLKEAAQLFDIQLLDHLIISSDDFVSLANKGVL